MKKETKAKASKSAVTQPEDSILIAEVQTPDSKLHKLERDDSGYLVHGKRATPKKALLWFIEKTYTGEASNFVKNRLELIQLTKLAIQ